MVNVGGTEFKQVTPWVTPVGLSARRWFHLLTRRMLARDPFSLCLVTLCTDLGNWELSMWDLRVGALVMFPFPTPLKYLASSPRPPENRTISGTKIY